jgi:tRNA pseudouridine65 synthase
LVFALSSKAARFLTQEFTEGRVGKNYLAVVRGFSPDTKLIDYPLKEITELKNKNEVKKSMPEQTAQTYIQTLAKIEINQCVDKFPTSRYSLVKAQPKTGRNHQIRRHLRHLGHPIIGDVNYGSGVHNRFFRQNYQSHRLLLACTEISFLHPTKNEVVHVKAPLAEDFSQLIDQLGWAYVG